jgi:hypothetical protein
LKYRIPPFTARFIAYLVLNIDIENGGRYRMKLYKRDGSILTLGTVHFYIATFQQQQCME